jgi:ParB-like chromosome segregation protein Spo0J
MTTSLITTLSLETETVRRDHLRIYRHHFLNAVHEFLYGTFRRLADANLMTQADLARRIHRDTASVSRWLAEPKNIELNTLSDLMVGMAIDPTTLLADALEPPSAVTKEPAAAPQAAQEALKSIQAPPEPSQTNPHLRLVKPPAPPPKREPVPSVDRDTQDAPRTALG